MRRISVFIYGTNHILNYSHIFEYLFKRDAINGVAIESHDKRHLLASKYARSIKCQNLLRQKVGTDIKFCDVKIASQVAKNMNLECYNVDMIHDPKMVELSRFRYLLIRASLLGLKRQYFLEAMDNIELKSDQDYHLARDEHMRDKIIDYFGAKEDPRIALITGAAHISNLSRLFQELQWQVNSYSLFRPSEIEQLRSIILN